MKRFLDKFGVALFVALVCVFGGFAVQYNSVWQVAPSVAHAQLGATWTQMHAPAANTQATISQAASTTGGVYVLDCAVAKLAATGTAPTAVTVNLVIRDGASGAGTIKYQQPMSVPAVAGSPGDLLSICGLNIIGTANTAMTIEFSAGGGANTTESVFMRGYTR